MRNTSNDFGHIRNRTSASQLKMFDMCPLAFKHKYILSHKAKYPPKTDLAFYAGRKVHEVADSCYKLWPETHELNSKLKTWMSISWDMKKPYEAYEMAMACVNHFVDFETIRRRKYDYSVDSEVKKNNEGFYGILDFHDQQEQCVIDWKTGKSARLGKNYKIQAAVYAILAETKIINFYYLYANKIKTVKITEEMIDEVLTLKSKILVALDNDEFKREKHCKWCPFSHCCSRKLRY